MNKGAHDSLDAKPSEGKAVVISFVQRQHNPGDRRCYGD